MLDLSAKNREGEKWTITVPGVNGSISSLNAVPLVHTPGYVLVRIDYEEGLDTVYLWTGSEIDIQQPPDPQQAASLSAPLSGFDGVVLAGGYIDLSFDEIRIATTFHDVVGYANPAMLILVK